jgi:hypothetical protein
MLMLICPAMVRKSGLNGAPIQPTCPPCALAPAHHIDHAKPRQQVARVADVELEVERRAPLGAARLGHAPGTAQQGLARGGQAGFGRGDVELAQAPFPLGPFGAAVLGFDLDATELAAAQLEVVHHHVHRGHEPGCSASRFSTCVASLCGMLRRDRRANRRPLPMSPAAGWRNST